MNKQIFKLLFFVAPILTFVGCSDDEDIKPAPSVSVTGAPAAALPGEEISFTANVTAPNGGDKLSATVGSTEIANIDLGGQTSSSQTINYTIPAGAVVGSEVTIVLQATDKKNLPSAIASVVVSVNNPIITLEGNLTSLTLDATKRYLLKGQVFIKDGVTVNIPAGTVIFGDKATKATLIVERGGMLNCNGTADAPVVMTSYQTSGERDKGDWGGLVILGKAFTNQNTAGGDPNIEGISPSVFFGANTRTNDNDNSGTYKYLRVEYAGIELSPNNETNSITMGGVGSGTVMEYCMVSFGGDDGFEWFGGTVNGKYLISHSTWDDDFDVDYGWSGNVQFALAVRNPFYADQSQSNGFETDNGPNDNDSGAGTYTNGVFANVTIYGPRDRQGRSLSANNAQTLDLRRRTALSIFNSVMGGFPVGLRFNQNSVKAQYDAGTGVLAHNILIAGGSGSSQYAAGSGVGFTADDVKAYWEASNTTVEIPAEADQENFYTDLGLRIDNFFARYNINSYPSNPDFTLASATSTLAEGADFTHAKFSETGRSDFFDTTVEFRGAFGTEDWTNGWAEFRPITTAY